MGLIKAGVGALGGILADQWKEYFYCDAMDKDTLAVMGKKRVSGRSSNTKGNDNIISNGSVIAVADGQCMMIVEQGKVVDLCAEPGEYTYDKSTEPSIFTGNLSEQIQKTFQIVGKRFTFGGDTGKDQRVYYFNTKELVGNKYGTPSPVPFRVVDERAGIDIDIGVRCFGEYSFRMTNPLLFYTSISGNMSEVYERTQLEGQMKSELLTALQPAFARLSALGVRYSELPGHTAEMADALNEILSAKWRDLRGLEIVSIGVSSVRASDEDEKMLKEMQRNAAFMDPTRAAANLAGAQMDTMKTAAANEGGAMTGFMGMGMAMNSGSNAANLYAMGQQQRAAAPTGQQWKCGCGATVSGKFCPECGTKKPEPKPANGWTCKCGTVATGKFCPECGAPKPADEGWKCGCGAVNKGKFCSECGAKKPAGVPLYRCDKCGWEPEDPANPPKFCPECGDRFDENDIK